MSKKLKDLVDSLIKNEDTKWTDEHREFLEGQEEAFVESLVPEALEEKPAPTGNTEVKAPVTKPAGSESIVDSTPAPAPTPAPQNLEQLLANAAPELQGMIRNGIATYKANRETMVQAVLTQPGCTFNEAQLNAMPDDILDATHRLAQSQRPVEAPPQAYPSYAGAVGYQPSAAPQANQGEDAEPLELPSTF